MLTGIRNIIMFNQLKSHLIFLFIFSFAFTQNNIDLQKMRAEYEKMQTNKNQFGIENSNENLNSEISSTPNRAVISPYLKELIKRDSIKSKENYFGYDFFTKRDSVAFWENLPTPPNYLLGPGDELTISIWGETQLRKNYTISREGSIYDEKIGLLTIAGRTISEAQEYLLNQFGRVYSTLNGNKPSSFIDLSLGALGSINVNFVGEIKYPGVYPIHPFSNLITGIIQAGGIDTTGSLRNIILKRPGKKEKTIDLYSYFIKGNLPDKIQLRNQDVIVVPPRLSTVRVDSAVLKPGVYEAKPNETILDIINYAGGLISNSSGTIGLNRIQHLNQETKNNFENFYFNSAEAKIKKVQNGDKITAFKIYRSEMIVEIFGQVKNPGKFSFSEGMTVSKLLELSGGIDDSLFLKSVDLENAKIIRRDHRSKNEKIIHFDLLKVLRLQRDVKLENFDRVVINPNKNFFDRKTVQIRGEVKKPGHYAISKKSQSLKSLIELAGGFSSEALKDGIAIYRESKFFDKPPNDKFLIESDNPENNNSKKNYVTYKEKIQSKIKLAWHDKNINLMPGDSIIIKRDVGAVYVVGEVYNPGMVTYNPRKSLNYYVNAAGGFNNFGDKKNIVIIYPNGISVPKRPLGFTKIKSGSTIIVYRKADLTPIKISDIATNTTSLISSLVTLILVTRQVQ